MSDQFSEIEKPQGEADTPGKKKKKSAPKKKQNRSELTVPEMQKGFYYMFFMFKRGIKSSEEIDEKDFTNLAKAYVDLANRFPALKVLALLMAPLATVGEVVELTRRIWSKRTKKPKEQRQPQPTDNLYDGGPNDQPAEGITQAVN